MSHSNHTITLQELHQFFLTLTTEQQETILGTKPEEDDLTYDSFSSWFNCCTNWVHINGDQLSYTSTDNDYITFSTTFSKEIILEKLNTWINWVMRSYENDLWDWEQNAWDLGYCSSDDDVDYQGTYLIVVSDVLNLYLEQFLENYNNILTEIVDYTVEQLTNWLSEEPEKIIYIDKKGFQFSTDSYHPDANIDLQIIHLRNTPTELQINIIKNNIKYYANQYLSQNLGLQIIYRCRDNRLISFDTLNPNEPKEDQLEELNTLYQSDNNPTLHYVLD